MNAQDVSYETILQIIYTWPPASRLALVQDILETLRPEFAPLRSQRNTLDQALGLLEAGGQPAPTDEDVEQWIAESRLAKYG